MKKHILLSLVLFSFIMLFLSCTEQIEKISEKNSHLIISAGLPSAIHTYSSDKGGINNLDEDVYDLNYILEVWSSDMNNLVYRDTKTLQDGFSNSVNFELRLPATKYKLALFASFSKNNEQGQPTSYYNADNNLKTVQLQERVFGDDAADAYYACKDIDLSSQDFVTTVTMTRPVGKIRILATDVISEGSEYGLPSKVKLTYNQENVPALFNVVTGESSGSIANEEFTFDIPLQKESLEVDGEVIEGYVLGYDYILPVAETSAYSFTISVYDENELLIGSRELSNIPVLENKLTTIYGNFYSSVSDITVNISDSFEDQPSPEPDENVSVVETSAELNQMLTNYSSDVDADNLILDVAGTLSEPVVLPQTDKSVTLNFTVPQENAVNLSSVTDAAYKGKLIINNTSSELSLNVDLSGAETNIGNGNFADIISATAENNIVISENASVDLLDVQNGEVILNYGIVSQIEQGSEYKGKIYRILSSQKSMDNLIADNTGLYNAVRVIEKSGIVDAKNFTLSKPLEISSDIEIHNMNILETTGESNTIADYGLASVLVNAGNVVFDNLNVKNASASSTRTFIVQSEDGADVTIRNSYLFVPKVQNKAGLNISLIKENSIVNVNLENVHISYSESLLNESKDNDYTYTPDMEECSFLSRAVSVSLDNDITNAEANINIDNCVMEGVYQVLNIYGPNVNANISNSILDGVNVIFMAGLYGGTINVSDSKLIGRDSGEKSGYAVITYNDGEVFAENFNVALDNSEVVFYNYPSSNTRYGVLFASDKTNTLQLKNNTLFREAGTPKLDYIISANSENSNIEDDGTTRIEGCDEGTVLIKP